MRLVYPVYKLPREKVDAIVDYCIEISPDNIYEELLNFIRSYYDNIFYELTPILDYTYGYDALGSFHLFNTSKSKVRCDDSLVEFLVRITAKKENEVLVVSEGGRDLRWDNDEDYYYWEDWEDEQTYYKKLTKGKHTSRKHNNKHKHRDN